MLTVNRDTVCFIILKAHEFHATEQAPAFDDVDDGSDEYSAQIPADQRDNPTFVELKSTIDDLEPDQQICLVALMWLGRGEFGVDEWESALLEARRNWNGRTAEYLIETPLVADFLAEGLSQLGYSCDE